MTVDNGKRTFPSRREFLSLGIGAFVVGSLPLVARARKHLVRRTIPSMGTLGEVAVVHKDERYAQGAIDAAFQELRRVEALLTRFRADSEIGLVNLQASAGPQPVSEETLRVLETSLTWAQETGGAFDPCLGKVVSLWDVANRRQPPAAEEALELARGGYYQALELGVSGGQPAVLFHDSGMALDLGGIGKGYGVDRAVAALRDWGIENGLVNLGGDLYALGVSEDGDPWKVGVRSPDDPDGIATTFTLSDGAVATSGDYHQYFEFGGRRYHHLLDPQTGEPARVPQRSVTVAADRCLDADAGATAAFVAGPVRARRAFPRVAPGTEIVHTV